MLKGLSLRDKSNFFNSLDTPSAAYWLNHTGVLHWLSKLRDKVVGLDSPLYALIESMMAMEPGRRPTANALVDSISSAPYRTAGYTRQCCFDDVHSDTTSWQGSDVEEDDIFETAHGTSDKVTMSSVGAPAQHRRTSSPPTSAYEESELENDRSDASTDPKSGHFQGEMQEEQSVISCRSSTYDNSVTAPRSMIVDVTPQNSNRASSISREVSLHSSTSRPVPSFHALSASGAGLIESNTIVLAKSRIAEQVLLESHERLESHLLELRKCDPMWQSLLRPLMLQEIRDKKGFNILTMACKFDNTILSNEVVGASISVNPNLITNSTNFQNTALHHAAHKGRMSTVTKLLENGASAGAQNSRGQTALHIALREEKYDIAECLINFMSLNELDAVNDMGKSAIHIMCWQQNSLSVVKALLDAGCKATTGDLRGHTPLQICQEQNNIDVLQQLVQAIPVRRSNQKFEPIPRGEAYWRHHADLDLTDCHCDWCSICVALEKAGKEPTSHFVCCPCPNHVTVFVKDTLSQRHTVDNCLRHCLCKACVHGREHNETRSPCGTPISSESMTCNDSIQSNAQPYLTSANSSLSSTSLLHDGKPLVPYLGHQYYDDSIDDKLRIRTSNMSQEEITAMVLSTLADAGFKGSKSYRKFPDDAARWIIDHYDANLHVTKMVDIILDCGADVNVTSRGRGLLSIAAEKGDLALTRLLLDKHVIIDPPDAVPSSEIRSVVSRLRNRLVNSRADNGSTNALRTALLHGQMLACRMLLAAGADINRLERRAGDNTLLHAAVARYSTLGGYIPFLLAHGALLDLKDESGNTALHIAVKGNHLEAVQILLHSAADANVVNKKDETPLGLAIYSSDRTHGDPASHQEHYMVTLLLTYGANPHGTCNTCPCPLFCALLYNKLAVAQLLLDEYSAAEDVHRVDEDGSGLLHYLAYLTNDHAGPLIDRLLGYAPELNVQNVDGDTPLHAAAIRSNLTLARKLVERKAITGVQNRKGNTPLDFARSLRFRVIELEECLRAAPTKRRKK